MKGVTVGAVLFVLVVFVAVFLLASFAVMLLGNVVLGHYDAKLLTYPVAMAVTALSIILFGGSRVGSSNK